MPIPHYRLDDRSFDDLVSEMLARIPGHTPEWTNPRLGDPGRTLIELFAWLADTLLYRVNLLPERQRLAFLRLLNLPLRPARAASGLVALAPATDRLLQPVAVPLYTPVKGPVAFGTVGEVTVLPVQGRVYVKRTPTEEERAALEEVISGLVAVYGVPAGDPYITTPLFAEGAALRAGFDPAAETVDRCLWIALTAPTAEAVDAVRAALGRDAAGSKVLNVGLAPRLAVPRWDEEVGTARAARDGWAWEITSPRLEAEGEPEYLTLDVVLDTTEGFTRQGVVRLELPDRDDIGVPENRLDADLRAGVGDRPPRIDDEQAAARLVAWVRLRPRGIPGALPLSWMGINAVEVDQRTTVADVVVGTSTGAADQTVALPGTSVDPATLALEVEEPGRGFVPWTRVEDLAAASRDDRAYALDPEAGEVTFGDGVRGRVPAVGMRVRVGRMRAGGGAGGNLEPGNLTAIAHPGLKVLQPLATGGGADAETLDEAEKRIPAVLAHGDRAVTAEDYRRLALDAPAVDLGRVEVLPRFKPQQRRPGVPGVVSVAVLPKAASRLPPNPRPDRATLERVHAHLDRRRPVAAELYVIGVEYVPLGVAAAVGLRDGHARDRVLQGVRSALRDFLWPLAPGGADGRGWPLGQAVSERELEVVVARVEGVRTVTGVNLFGRRGAAWERIPPDPRTQTPKLLLEEWQLPELLSVVIVEDEDRAPTTLETAPPAGEGPPAVPIPVVPEVC
ncbi:MAG: putative baseplate assembly protein [Deferrisomatales bacterium]